MRVNGRVYSSHMGFRCVTAQKMKFSIKNFFSKRDQICSFLRIWSHLLKKSLMENFIFCAVCVTVWKDPSPCTCLSALKPVWLYYQIICQYAEAVFLKVSRKLPGKYLRQKYFFKACSLSKTPPRIFSWTFYWKFKTIIL